MKIGSESHYYISTIILFIAWTGFCINVEPTFFNTKADVIMLSIGVVCVLLGVIQTIRICPNYSNKKIIPITITGCAGIAASCVGIFVV